MFAFPNNYNHQHSPPIQYIQLYIHTPDPNATFVVTAADGGYNYTGTCSPLNPAIVNIPLVYEVSRYELGLTQKALKVSTNQDITVVAWSYNVFHWLYSAALVYPACEATSTTQLYTYYPLSTEPQWYSQLLIIGCQDDSIVRITPTQNITIPADIQSPSSSTVTVAAGASHSLILHSIQTLVLSFQFDITGTKIISNKPLSIISGTECANIPNDVGNCDFLMTHVPPTHQWDRQFLLSPHRSRFAQGYKILAQADGTLVITTCNESAITNYMLNDQQSVVFFTHGDTYCSVESTNVIYMVQLGVGGRYEDDGIGDPTINNIPPIEQHVYSVQFTALFENSYYSIVVQNDNLLFNGNIILDGTVQTISTWRNIHNSDGDIVGYGYTSEVCLHYR